MAAESHGVEDWPRLLTQSAASTQGVFESVTVLRETDSTQDAARRLCAAPGAVIVAWRQRAGRGRLGRAWADTGDQGVAATLVLPRDRPERLAIASAIGTALAVETLLEREAGIKWPNDIMVEQRKLAGILVEQTGETALIGIGMNVSQTAWPEHLARRAVSLRLLGVTADRVEVLDNLIRSLAEAVRMSDTDLTREFARRDVLAGTTATFLSGAQCHTGRVLRVEAMKGLAIEVDGREIWLPAATTTVQPA